MSANEDRGNGQMQRGVSAPDWLLKREGITGRQWKARKREELKAVISAFRRYRMGCAYCPGYDSEVERIGEVLRKLSATHSVREWGR